MLKEHSLVTLALLGLLVASSVIESVSAADCSGGVVACAEIYAPVCGSDGKTYSNKCELGLAQCTIPTLTLKSDDECPDDSASLSSSPSPSSSVGPSPSPRCGSDQKTYSSECELDFERCFKPALKRVSNGECPSGNSSSGDAGSGSDGGSSVVLLPAPSSSSSSSRVSTDVVAPAADTNKSDGVSTRAASVNHTFAVGVVGVACSLFLAG